MKTKIFRNGDLPKGLVFCNLKTSKTELPTADTLPTLVRDETMQALLKNEENPRYTVEAIDFPVKGDGGHYTKQFFQSYLNRMKAHPFGGNKLGHSWPEKNDFYTVGGKIEENGKDSGTVYFKIFIPAVGYETTNSGFIRDVEAKNVHFSLVTMPEFELKKNDETGEMERYFTASVGMERNDAVPFEGGAMAQRVNSKSEYEQAKDLIRNGQVNYNDPLEGEEFIHNGKVYRSVLRRMASHANGDAGASELLSLIDKRKNQKGKKPMEKEELIQALKGLYMNGLVSMADIATGIGSTAPEQLRNEADHKNAELVKRFNELLGDNPVEEAEKLLNTRSENERYLVENAVRDQIGTPKVKNAKGEEIDNPAYLYAKKVCNGLAGKALRDALDGLKADTVMQNLLSSQADIHSEFNRVEGGQETVKNAAPAVMEV
jgi:hypothetical protein